MNQTILQGNALDKLKELKDNSIDLIATDPPYGYSFMNKDWDKAIISVDTWRECLRVLKPGAFAFVMSAPRQDVLSHMIVNLGDAGFVTNFTSIYWVYASGFPKAANISKMVDKKLGNETNNIKRTDRKYEDITNNNYSRKDGKSKSTKELYTHIPTLPQAKKLDGSYAGFQPKPALEVILVCMKPLSEKNYVEQAMNDGKGITWLDDCKIPFVDDKDVEGTRVGFIGTPLPPKKGWNSNNMQTPTFKITSGRFPANILVSGDALNDGEITKSNGHIPKKSSQTNHGIYGKFRNWDDRQEKNFNDSGSFSRYFNLDAWSAQFLIVEKASKSEKNAGLENLENKIGGTYTNDKRMKTGLGNERNNTIKNNHPTVKPISLMVYLITMGSRKGDTVLDPFAGSGTTLIAASLLERDCIGIERDPHYCNIIKHRINYWKNKSFEKLEKIKKHAEKKKIVPLEKFL